uniref:Alpha-tocopherol transfer protein-like n=1 Tax=Cacopsylla melanoneura TaxID=428564 RepID=A0A8D9DT70_9HEMI
MKTTSADEEYAKNSELKREDITALRKWREAQDGLPELSERDLIVFHQSCFYNEEDTKSCIQNYFKIRSKHPTYFSNRDPGSDCFKKYNDVIGYYILDGFTLEGYRVLLMRLINTSPSAYSFNDALKLYTMYSDVMFQSSGSCPGDLIVYDMAGTSFGHLPKLNVSGFRNMLQYLQEGLPVRLKGIHMINAIPFVDIVINMMTPFMKKELLDMFQVSTSCEVLNKLLPSRMIPKEYGGDGKSLPELHEQTTCLVESYRDFFIQDDERRLSPSSLKKKGSLDKDSPTKVSSGFRKLELD